MLTNARVRCSLLLTVMLWFSFEAALGFSGGAESLVTYKRVDGFHFARSFAFTGPFTLTHKTVVVASVRGTNEAGLARVVQSSGVVVDETPPTFVLSTFVHVGASGTGPVGTSGATFQSHGTGFAARVMCSEDIPGHPVTYSVQFGTSPSGAELAGPIHVPASPTSAPVTALSGAVSGVADKATVWASGSCTNEAGMTTAIAPFSVVVDETPPDVSGATVAHIDTSQAGASEVSFSGRDAIEATWIGWTDSESDMVSPCTWAVALEGDTPSDSAFVEATTPFYATTSAATFPLVHGETYHFWVRCYNGAGAFTTVTGAGVTIHRLVPKGGIVSDGAGGMWATPLPVSSVTLHTTDAALAATALNTAAALADGLPATGVATEAGSTGAPTHATISLVQGATIDAVTAVALDAVGGAAAALRVETFSFQNGWTSRGQVVPVAPGSNLRPLRFAPTFAKLVRLSPLADDGSVLLSEVGIHQVDIDGIDGTVGQPTSLAASWAGIVDPTGIVKVEWSVASCPGEPLDHTLFTFTESGVSVAARTAVLPNSKDLVEGIRYGSS